MKRIILTITVLAVLIGLNNCGYKLSGYGSQLPATIKKIVIPDFENKSIRAQVDQYVTYAVKEEFIKRANLTIVDKTEDADALLEGTIMSFDVKAISAAADASANLYRINITVNVRLTDLKNSKILFEGEGISVVDNYQLGTNDFISLENQTLLKIADDFAASIVTTILEKF